MAWLAACPQALALLRLQLHPHDAGLWEAPGTAGDWGWWKRRRATV